MKIRSYGWSMARASSGILEVVRQGILFLWTREINKSPLVRISDDNFDVLHAILPEGLTCNLGVFRVKLEGSDVTIWTDCFGKAKG